MKRSGFKPRQTELRATAPAKAEVRLLPQRKCPVKKDGCGQMFRPFRKGQIACLDCAVPVGRWFDESKKKTARKEQDAKDRARLLELKKLSHHHDLTKDAVNAYIRARDADQPCISCDTLTPSAWHAGHYMSVGSESALRYDPANIHRQCLACNVHKGSNAIQYRIRLVQRIGLAEVERLEGPQPVVKWTRESLKAIRDEFRRKAREVGKT